MMREGVCVVRQEGTPQGGPLSPLLANLLLDDLDKELERQGIGSAVTQMTAISCGRRQRENG